MPNHDPATWQLGGRPLASFAAARSAIALPANPRPAAVLVPIIDRPAAPTLLLTTRAAHLRDHAGQISFPGGRIETRDDTVAAAAVREAQEEIGLEARLVEPIGFLPDQFVLTGFRITPVVALVRADFTVQIDTAEVAEVFEVPLAYLSQGDHFQARTRVLMGVEVTLEELHFEGRIVWGATAGMLHVLRSILEKTYE